MLDDEPALIARAQRGNLDAFNELVLHYQDAAFTLAYRLMGDSASASDTAQEAMIAAYRKLNTYRGGSFRAWLLRIVTNRCYDELRRAQRRPTISLSGSGDGDAPEPLDVPAPDATPEEEVLANELQRAIQDCINGLNADQRLVLVLSDIEGLSYEEIAAQSGSQLGTVKSRLSRARANVRDCLAAVRELLPAQFRLREEA
ncbi:MAG: sigma-70 family RNA polymerase sigma factor [Anaerolineae bacterium]|nr:sigma-70 family RNA polymerase sigma factor [Anaerolineae bacterium]MCA9908547.1 sigma-70 family RNA polymerase sigma factor [Anaerolineae bacterium]